MAAPITIQDLPDDMLHEIFGHVFAGEPSWPVIPSALPPAGTHLALRSVCRRWCDIADWARLATSCIDVDTSALADVDAVRARHPAAIKHLGLKCQADGHSTSVSRAAASLINGSADLRRALTTLQLASCCLPALSPAVAPIASCTALTKLCFLWSAHEELLAAPSTMLAPLSALPKLEALVFMHSSSILAVGAPALLAPLPALPDAPRLTYLGLLLAGNFVPVGSDAALGRLRQLELKHWAPAQELVDAEDPFLLRAAVDAGTWQPSRLTGLQDLSVLIGPVHDELAPVMPALDGSPAGSEWAPLAGQVTSLIVRVESDGYSPPSTGIVAGLGALTALRALRVDAADMPPMGLLDLVSIDRVRAPLLTHVDSNCVSTPYSLALFPNLVYVRLGSLSGQRPLNLRSLVARSSLKTLLLANRLSWEPVLINLAELFVGGGGWPVLEHLALRDMMLEWDTTGLARAPTAAEFAGRARQLLPALDDVIIEEPHGRDALPDRSRVAFVVACRRHVVPALKGFDTFGN